MRRQRKLPPSRVRFNKYNKQGFGCLCRAFIMKLRSELTSGSIFKGLLAFALPLLLTNLLQQLYSMMDTVVVGQFVGHEAVAAIGTTNAFTNMLVSFFIGLSTGGGVVIARCFGAKNYDALGRAVHTSFCISIIGGVILTAAGVAVSPLALRLIGVPDDVFGMAETYMQVYFAAALFVTVYNMGAGILRAVGDSRRPLIYLLICSVVNVVLNIIFVVFFKMGVAGVAWATFISEGVSAVAVTLHLLRTKEAYRLVLRELRIDRAALSQILKIGVPTGLQSVIISLSNVILQATVNTTGSVDMAGFSAAGKIDAFVQMPISVMGCAVTTFTGQNIGAGEADRVRRGTRTAFIMTEVCTVAVGAAALIFIKPLLSLINNEQAVIDSGAVYASALVTFYWIFAVSEILAGTIRGAGYAFAPMMVTLTCMCVFRVIWLWIMTPYLGSVRSVAYCYPVSWTIAAVAETVIYFKGRWRRVLGIAARGKQAKAVSEK